MNENVLETLRHLLQDTIAPDLRELKVRIGALEREMNVRFDAVNARFDAIDSRFRAVDERLVAMDQKFEQRFSTLDQKIDFHLQTILSAISEAKAHGELSGIKAIVSIAERVAVLEAKSK